MSDDFLVGRVKVRSGITRRKWNKGEAREVQLRASELRKAYQERLDERCERQG